jgi:hypothetical protein
VLDIGRPLTGPGADVLERSLEQVLTGNTSHGGALLSQFGIRYLVADGEELSGPARAVLDAQADLDLVNAAGLVIYRNAIQLPPAAVLGVTDEVAELVGSDLLVDIQRFPRVISSPLEHTEGGFAGRTFAGGNLAFLSYEFDGAWQLDQGSEPGKAFGWATSFSLEEGSVNVTYEGQLPRTVGTWLLGAFWAAALWFTRKPVPR